ncbi:hypothetical protein JTB14_013103 [Gonioctena quinquepunctata]|nr:hypothetical protein JTB14_013103 [Gonioctena quinquepunctata]
MPVRVRNVYHVPELRVNLLSVSQIVDNGNTVDFDSKGALDLDSLIPIFLAAPNTGILWHSRMGHVGLTSMEKLKTLVHGIDSDPKVASDFVCGSCHLVKVGVHLPTKAVLDLLEF